VSADQIIAAVAAEADGGVGYDGGGHHTPTPDSTRAGEDDEEDEEEEEQEELSVGASPLNIDDWADDEVSDLSSTRVLSLSSRMAATWGVPSDLDSGGDTVRLGSSYRRRTMSKANPQRGFLTEL
jgi:hypothetical protein